MINKKMPFIALFLIISFYLYAVFTCHNWTSNEKGIYEFEDNGINTDCSGNNYSLTAYGTGGSTQTSPVKYDSQSYTSPLSNNDQLVPSGVQVELGNSATWTIMYWFWIPSTGRKDHRITRGTYAQLDLLFGGYSGGALTNLSFWYNNVNYGPACTLNANAWNLVVLNYNQSGNYVKLYVNNSISLTINTNVNIFSSRTNDGSFHLGTETGISYGVYQFQGLDRLIFSTSDTLGNEITPVVSTPTSTLTHTVTPTFTLTPTPNFVITKTADKNNGAAGDTVNFTINYSMTGNCTGKSIIDLIDDNFNFISSNPTPTSINDKLYYFGVTDGPDVSGTITMTGTLKYNNNGVWYTKNYAWFSNAQDQATVEINTPTLTHTLTATLTQTLTHTLTHTLTVTLTPTNSFTLTPTLTHTLTQTQTWTLSPTLTQTMSFTASPTITNTPTPQIIYGGSTFGTIRYDRLGSYGPISYGAKTH